MMTHPRILLVEDNPGDAFLACEWLREAPHATFQVEVASTLAAARAVRHQALLNRAPMDAVVLDLNLPDSAGLQTLRDVRAAALQAPVIVVSGRVDETLRAEILAAGAEDVFEKSETNNRLFSRSVLFVIERSRARLQQARLLALLDSIPEAILVAGAAGELLFANPSAHRLFGPDIDGGLLAGLLRAQPDEEGLERALPCHGGTRICELRMVPLDWGGAAARLVSIRDMTMRNHAEQLRLRSAELELQNQRISEASRLKSAFLANMSHELRTPLNAVIGLSYVLQRSRVDAEQASHLHQIQVAGKSLLAVIGNVLDVSKIEAGELHIEQVVFDPRRALGDVVALFAEQAHAKRIAFRCHLPDTLPALLQGDAARLHQMLGNLLSNAIKFTERGQVLLAVHDGGRQANGHVLRFAVQDTGIGIAPDALQRLFKPFVQADTSTTRRYGGTGLGLSIVKQVAERMGGRVGASSVPGQGSEFWIELGFAEVHSPPAGIDPQATTLPEDACAATPSLPAAGARLAGVRVLVVDDNEINLRVAQRILELEGACVQLAHDGAQAVDCLFAEGHGIDLVLMDVQMPVLDGRDATRRIRQVPALASLPVIAITAGALLSERHEAQAAGMNDFISKPFDPENLIACIARNLRRPAGGSDRPEWPEIDGIDRHDVQTRLGGDLGLFRDLLAHLFDGLPALQQQAGCGSPEAWAAKAARMHDIKGVSATLGAHRLAAAAAVAETAWRREEPGPAHSASLQALAQLQALQAASALLWSDQKGRQAA